MKFNSVTLVKLYYMSENLKSSFERPKESIAVNDLIGRGILHLNYQDIDHITAVDLYEYLVDHPLVNEIDMGGRFVRDGFETDDIIDLSVARKIKYKNYYGIAFGLRNEGVEVEFYNPPLPKGFRIDDRGNLVQDQQE